MRRWPSAAARYFLLRQKDSISCCTMHAACAKCSIRNPVSLFVALQAVTAARVVELKTSSDGQEFLHSEFAKTNGDFWWPGDATQFSGVRCLLPNHYLDLRARRPVRYAPRHGRLEEKSVEEAVNIAAPILVNLIRGVAERYRLALPI